jgi:hypothetical protein
MGVVDGLCAHCVNKLNVSKLREWEAGSILKCKLLFREFKFKNA